MIHAGEQITCENGHAIVTATRDIHMGDMQHPDKDWTDWRQSAPETGTPLPRVCAICGAPWVRWNIEGGEQLHISHGWEPHAYERYVVWDTPMGVMSGHQWTAPCWLSKS